eukprot:1726632-Rhodomonas_salina.1
MAQKTIETQNELNRRLNQDIEEKERRMSALGKDLTAVNDKKQQLELQQTRFKEQNKASTKIWRIPVRIPIELATMLELRDELDLGTIDMIY